LLEEIKNIKERSNNTNYVIKNLDKKMVQGQKEAAAETK
tara:strand:+ start:297 stop:413 length:117 start_codon:yes stop_codon:yes gene_type:complete